jgi:thymidylate synthase (FAD)
MNKVSLIAHTTPHTNKRAAGIKNCTDLVAYCARVSNPNNQFNTDSASKLLNYCIKNNHWSIFEMANITLEIQTTRDIGRQILRHRSFSFQEFSQRYASVENMKITLREARLQDKKNRQNSIEIENGDIQNATWENSQQYVWQAAIIEYERALKEGIAKEVARALLPEGLTSSTMYMNGTLRSWMHYIKLRTGNGTQKEHIDVARKCAAAIAPIFPMITELVQ